MSNILVAPYMQQCVTMVTTVWFDFIILGMDITFAPCVKHVLHTVPATKPQHDGGLESSKFPTDRVEVKDTYCTVTVSRPRLKEMIDLCTVALPIYRLYSKTTVG